MIDLSRYINTVKVDLPNQTVVVGGGAIWKNVDDATYPHGYAAVSGTVNDVCSFPPLSLGNLDI